MSGPLECSLIVLLPGGDTKRKDDVVYDRAFGGSLKKNDGDDRVLWPFLVP